MEQHKIIDIVLGKKNRKFHKSDFDSAEDATAKFGINYCTNAFMKG